LTFCWTFLFASLSRTKCAQIAGYLDVLPSIAAVSLTGLYSYHRSAMLPCWHIGTLLFAPSW